MTKRISIYLTTLFIYIFLGTFPSFTQVDPAARGIGVNNSIKLERLRVLNKISKSLEAADCFGWNDNWTGQMVFNSKLFVCLIICK